MKASSLFFCITVSLSVILLLSIGAQANEYREINEDVNASNISKHIENGDDIYLDNCRIVGELNASKMKLKTVHNPYFFILSNKHSENELINGGLNKKSRIIESNITIENSIFKNKLNFSNVQFKNNLSFNNSYFTDDVNFIGANFVNPVYFNRTEFKNFALFSYADFNNSVYFNDVKFTGYTDFYGAKFNSSAYFNSPAYSNANNGTKFRSNTEFSYANFTGPVDFSHAYFGQKINFNEADFSNFAYFTGATFNDASVIFIGPARPNKFIVDNTNYHIFSKYYNNINQFELADELYYNYRVSDMEKKKKNDLGFWSDLFLYSIYGFGVKPWHTIYSSILIILIFSLIYNTGPKMYFSSINKISFRFRLQGPIIHRQKGAAKENLKITFWDALYFSFIRFTNVGSGELYAEDKIWDTVEGLIGWATLGIFISTLTSFITRK
jgi:hypothetical protein